MKNCIQQAMEKRGMTAAELSRRADVPYGTVYDASIGKTNVQKMAVEKFIRIAHALEMTVEELYYGKPPERVYLDPRQVSLNGHFESFNEAGKDELSRMADRMSHDPSIRIEKDRQEDDRIQTAMGA